MFALNKKRTLVFDLGNTTCHFGLFEGGRLVKDWRIETKKIFSLKKLVLPAASLAIGCSVVPSLDKKLKKIIRPAPIFVNHKNIPQIKIATDHPAEVGTDRIINALAVYKKYKKDTIIIDLGTAITIDIVSRRGEYLGGIIFPGFNLCRAALAQGTAKLPLVELKKPKNLIGKNTADCIRSGIYYGITLMINSLVKKIKNIYKKDFLVVATGGNLELLAPEISYINVKNKFLTLEGLLEVIKIKQLH